MNALFSDRAEELVHHDAVLDSELTRKEHPDRIYGLRETKIFEKALSAIEDGVRCSPFKTGGEEPLLFPFLILEAKSEKGADSFSSIEKQTAFPIRTLLKLQEDLGDKSTVYSEGPLVFFFSNKGEEWRVAGCYIETTFCDAVEGYNNVSHSVIRYDETIPCSCRIHSIHSTICKKRLWRSLFTSQSVEPSLLAVLCIDGGT